MSDSSPCLFGFLERKEFFPLNSFSLMNEVKLLLASQSSDKMVRSFHVACFAKCSVPTYVPTLVFFIFQLVYFIEIIFLVINAVHDHCRKFEEGNINKESSENKSINNLKRSYPGGPSGIEPPANTGDIKGAG